MLTTNLFMRDSRLLVAAVAVVLIVFSIPNADTIPLLAGWIMLFYSLNELVFHYDKYHLDNVKEYVLLILLGTSLTLAIETVGQIVSPSWIYSFAFFSGGFIIPSLVAYILFIPAAVETYLFVRNVLKPRVADGRSRSIAVLLSAVGITLIVVGLLWQFPLFPGLPFAFFIVGVSFTVDMFIYSLIHRSVYLTAMRSARYAACIVIAAMLLALPIEYINTYSGAWRYVNLPFLDVSVFSIPLPILMGWIPLFVLWIDVYYLAEYSFLRRQERKRLI